MADIAEQQLLDILHDPKAVAAIKSYIFEEDGTAKLQELLRGALDMKLPRADCDRLVDALQLAWNHFPHSRLDGQSPAQAFQRLGKIS